jgi:hypothetical protein
LLDIAQRPLVGRFYSIDAAALDQALTPVRGHASRVIAELLTVDLRAAQRSGAIKSKARPGAIAELLGGAMNSALSQVARERIQPRDALNAIAALVASL